MSLARGIDGTSVALRLPVDGTWQIYQGFDGKHTHHGNWQYAVDFFQTVQGRSYLNAGAVLTDYYCYGKAVFSPVYGTVMQICDETIDNAPGQVNEVNNWGNFILIKLDSGEFLLLAHLRPHSIEVSTNMRVVPGQRLASVGNSGRSPQPHLHMHVQELQEIGSSTIPFHLGGLVLFNKDTERYLLHYFPEEGDFVSSPKRNAALKRALKFNVGCQLSFSIQRGEVTTSTNYQLEITLDINGQFWLNGPTGARVAFYANDEFISLYSRSGPKDDVLDALVLCISLTPLLEGSLAWSDSIPRRIFPISAISPISRLVSSAVSSFSPCVKSFYRRHWDYEASLWIQYGRHKLLGQQYDTSATFCESLGLTSFSLRRSGSPIITATLCRQGLRDDHGIPESQEVVFLAG
jgi:murein DD-endopeptidase MepM/ murein hydrolase activator NlpD